MAAGDATHQVSIDRVVYMSPSSSSPLIDGDRILVLYAMYLRRLLEDAGLLTGTRFVVVTVASTLALLSIDALSGA